jgi:hypothetical protein
MTNEELMNMMTDMGLHEGGMENWVMDNAWVEVAKRVAAHEREKVAHWMMERGYATGHGDTVEDLLKELDWQVAEREREGYRQGYADAMNWKTQNHLEHLPGRKQWVGLTKEEAKEISLANRPYVIDMIAALEARLKEKNT